MLLAGQRREILNLTDVHGGRLAGKGREGKGAVVIMAGEL
jgi:hypothetical protein